VPLQRGQARGQDRIAGVVDPAIEVYGQTIGNAAADRCYASDGEAGLSAALDGRPVMIVLDIMLPKINDYEVCRLIRKAGLDMLIIILTAKGQESDILLGLELGAGERPSAPQAAG